jgi:hypothetical protein
MVVFHFSIFLGAEGFEEDMSCIYKIDTFKRWCCCYVLVGAICSDICEPGDHFALNDGQPKYRSTFQYWHGLCEWNYNYILVALCLSGDISHCKATSSTIYGTYH